MQIILKIARIIFISALVSVVIFVLYLLLSPSGDGDEISAPLNPSPISLQVDEVEAEKVISDAETKTIFEDVFLTVPFTSQAPSAKWSNPLFENGCEEASVAMAMAWVEGRKFSVAGAEKEILDISAWEEKMFGFAIDSSVADTVRILREYYKYENIEILKDITEQDIKRELSKGRIFIAPADGKLLANPHYTPPGPDQHMLVVTGYDSKKDEFVTNDPGTRFGENYRYDAKIFVNAIWSYPSGSEHAPYPGSQNVQRDIISIGK